jgi:hypothetical protein
VQVTPIERHRGKPARIRHELDLPTAEHERHHREERGKHRRCVGASARLRDLSDCARCCERDERPAERCISLDDGQHALRFQHVIHPEPTHLGRDLRERAAKARGFERSEQGNGEQRRRADNRDAADTALPISAGDP